MAISCRNQQKIVPIDTRMLRRTLLRLLTALDCQSCDLGVLIIDDARMRRLNAHYRGIDRPTDVLAFAMREGPFADLNPQILGDVVLSAETALRQAQARGHSLAEELTRLLIHGTLHVLGYDHEVSPAAARLMRVKERALWRLVKPLLNLPPTRPSSGSEGQGPGPLQSPPQA